MFLQFRHYGGPHSCKEAGLGLEGLQIVGRQVEGTILGDFAEETFHSW